MENVVVVIILALIIGAAAFYVYRARKKGQKCIGCPHSSACDKCGCKPKK